MGPSPQLLNWYDDLVEAYLSASNRSILLDYDGTLSPFVDNPDEALPSDRLIKQLKTLSNDKRNNIVIISGRSKYSIGEWFKDIPITLVVEHGGFIRQANNDNWKTTKNCDISWKPIILNILEETTNKLPGSFVEHKDNSLVLHYRSTNQEQAQKNLATLKDKLQPLIQNFDLKIEQGNMILEIRPNGINKGDTAKEYSQNASFILAIGDDTTDEAMFEALPSNAWTIKVRFDKTAARYSVQNVSDIHDLLDKLSKQN